MAKARKLHLDRTFIYNGTFYGPGQIEIEDPEAAEAIAAKMEKLLAAGQFGVPVVTEVNTGNPPVVEQLPGGQQNMAAGDTVASRGGQASPGTVGLSLEEAADQHPDKDPKPDKNFASEKVLDAQAQRAEDERARLAGEKPEKVHSSVPVDSTSASEQKGAKKK